MLGVAHQSAQSALLEQLTKRVLRILLVVFGWGLCGIFTLLVVGLVLLGPRLGIGTGLGRGLLLLLGEFLGGLEEVEEVTADLFDECQLGS